MQTFKIKPTSKTKVLDPLTYHALKTKGQDKPKNSYWLSRIADGDVETITTKSKTQIKE